MNVYALRGLLFICALLGAVFLFRAPAQALVEICPAEVAMQTVDAEHEGPPAPAALYGLQLTTEGGARSVRATLALDTDAGWFTAAIPQTPLVAFRAKMSTRYATYEKQYWRSPKIYVDFGKPVTIKHYFLVNVLTDAAEWAQRGAVTCLPHNIPVPSQQHTGDNDKVRILNDDRDLSAAPAPGDTVLKAAPSPALASDKCAQPFKPAMARDAIAPNYPAELGPVKTVSVAEIALDADGNIVDAWTDRPSGYDAFDNAAVHAAMASKYSGAISYCTPIPSLYLFHVTFDPN